MDTCRESSGASGQKAIDRLARKSKPTARAGQALLLWIAALALVALGLLIWLFSGRGVEGPGEPSGLQPGIAASEGGVERPGADTGRDGTPLIPGPGLEVGRSERLPRPEPKAFDEKRLQGRGRIRGSVEAPPGIEFPQEWVLSVEPSTALIGRERAETRRLEFKAGEQEFAIEDLVLGGYKLRASAFGLASDSHELLLAKPNEADLYVQMQLSVTAFIEGSVRYEDSSAAVGLELFLEPKPTGPRVSTTSNNVGAYLFTDVKTGAYRIHFGRAENPVRPSIDVDVEGPAVHLPDAIVPRMAELIVRVVLTPGVPAPGVAVDGYGDHGGRIDGKTLENGEYRARFLPPGRYTVNARFADGRRVQGRQVIEAGVLGLIELVLEK